MKKLVFGLIGLALGVGLVSWPVYAQATGSPVPANGYLLGARETASTLFAMKLCDQKLVISNASLNGSAQLVAAGGSTNVFVCGFYVVVGSAVSVKFVEGTGVNCATSPTDITGAAPLAVNGGFTTGISPFAVIFTRVGGAVCINTSGATAIGGWMSYMTR